MLVFRKIALLIPETEIQDTARLLPGPHTGTDLTPVNRMKGMWTNFSDLQVRILTLSHIGWTARSTSLLPTFTRITILRRRTTTQALSGIVVDPVAALHRSKLREKIRIMLTLPLDINLRSEMMCSAIWIQAVLRSPMYLIQRI